MNEICNGAACGGMHRADAGIGAERKFAMKKWSKKKKAAALAAVLVIAVSVVTVSASQKSRNAGYVEIVPVVQDMSSSLKFSGSVEAAQTATVYAEASGKVLELLVGEGDTVKAGDVIAVLDSSDAEYEIALKEANLSSSQRNDAYAVKENLRTLENYEADLAEGYDSSVNSAQKALLSAQEEYQSAADDYNQAKEELEAGTNSSVVSARQAMESQAASYESALAQHEDGMMTDEALETYRVSYENACESYRLAAESAESELSDKESAVDAAQEALAAAERDYESVARSAQQNQETYQDNLEKSQAETEEAAKLELEHLKESLADYTILAPMDGTITTLSIQAGDMAAAPAGVAEMADFSVMQVAVKIDEQDVYSVKEGAEVSVYVGALDKTYEGAISSISKTAVEDNNAVYVEAVVEFAADEDVRSGFGAEVELVKESAQDAVCLPVDAVQYDTDHSAYVYVKDEKGNPEKRTITLGITDGSYVQVTEGLAADEVVLEEPSMAGGMSTPGSVRAQMMEQGGE